MKNKILKGVFILLLGLSGQSLFAEAAGPIFSPATSSPADDATDVAVDANLTLQFSANIQNFPGNTPVLILYKSSDDSIVESYTSVAATENNGSVGGTANMSVDTLVVNPGLNLTAGESYYILFPENELGDGNSSIVSPPTLFVGATTDETTYNFTVVGGADSDSTLTAAAGVDESKMIKIPTTATTLAQKVDVLDFTLTDAGSGDGLATIIDTISIAVEGTAAKHSSKIKWILNGDGFFVDDIEILASGDNVNGFSLNLTNADYTLGEGASATFTLSVYWDDPRGLTDNETFTLTASVTTADSNSSKLAPNQTVTNNANAKVDVTATELRFGTTPSNMPNNSN